MKPEPQIDHEEFTAMHEALQYAAEKLRHGHQVAMLPLNGGYTVSTPKRVGEQVSA